MLPEFKIIKTTRLLLRKFVEDDLENVFKGLSHPDVIKYYGVSYLTLEAARAQMIFFAELEKNGTGIWWAVCAADNRTFFGAAGFNNLKQEHKKAEIGFWLLPEFWRQGIMKEALPLMCNYAFDKLKLHRIGALAETENIGSKKVLEKLGFVHEGTMKECELKEGKYLSLDIYAKLNKGLNESRKL